MALIVLPTSRRLWISSRIPRHKGQNGYVPSRSGLSSFEVSLTTVGTVLTLYLSCNLVKKPSIKRSVEEKHGAFEGLAALAWFYFARGP